MLSEQAILLLWGTSAVLAMTIAMARDRHPALWLGVALLCGPAAMLVLLRLRSTGHYAAIRIDAGAMELCDSCFEPVRADRDQCRHCGAAPSPT